MEVGNTILKEANAKLQATLKNKAFKEVSVAQAMIEAAQKNISTSYPKSKKSWAPMWNIGNCASENNLLETNEVLCVLKIHQWSGLNMTVYLYGIFMRFHFFRFFKLEACPRTVKAVVLVLSFKTLRWAETKL